MPQPESAALNVAIRLLGRREHSAGELRGKLHAKQYDDDIVEQVLCHLREQGLQSDERFAHACTESLLRRGYGSLRVRHELRERGVAEELVQHGEVMATTDEFDRACEALQRKHPHSDRLRMVRFLAQRGYPGALAHRAAQNLLQQREDVGE